MSILQWYRDRKVRKEAAARLYEMVAVQSRSPVFYERLGVADTIDGRYDLLMLHIFLIMDRLNMLGPEAVKLSQDVFDKTFRTVELHLREMGIGDLGIPKHIKKMMKAFNGRAHSYHEALAAHNADALQLALTRNVYRTEGESIPPGVFELTDYVLSTRHGFEAMGLDQFESGQIWFPPVVIQRKEAACA